MQNFGVVEVDHPGYRIVELHLHLSQPIGASTAVPGLTHSIIETFQVKRARPICEVSTRNLRPLSAAKAANKANIARPRAQTHAFRYTAVRAVSVVR